MSETTQQGSSSNEEHEKDVVCTTIRPDRHSLPRTIQRQIHHNFPIKTDENTNHTTTKRSITTDLLLQIYSNRIFVTVSQLQGKIGSFFLVSMEYSIIDNSKTFHVVTLLGGRGGSMVPLSSKQQQQQQQKEEERMENGTHLTRIPTLPTREEDPSTILQVYARNILEKILHSSASDTAWEYTDHSIESRTDTHSWSNTSNPSLLLGISIQDYSQDCFHLIVKEVVHMYQEAIHSTVIM